MVDNHVLVLRPTKLDREGVLKGLSSATILSKGRSIGIFLLGLDRQQRNKEGDRAMKILSSMRSRAKRGWKGSALPRRFLGKGCLQSTTPTEIEPTERKSGGRRGSEMHPYLMNGSLGVSEMRKMFGSGKM